MDKLPIFLTALGLILDIAGVTVIYFIRASAIPIEQLWPKDGSYGISTDVKILADAIREINEQNEGMHRKTNWWFALIALGFILQLAASLMNYLASQDTP